MGNLGEQRSRKLPTSFPATWEIRWKCCQLSPTIKLAYSTKASDFQRVPWNFSSAELQLYVWWVLRRINMASAFCLPRKLKPGTKNPGKYCSQVSRLCEIEENFKVSRSGSEHVSLWVADFLNGLKEFFLWPPSFLSFLSFPSSFTSVRFHQAFRELLFRTVTRKWADMPDMSVSFEFFLIVSDGTGRY